MTGIERLARALWNEYRREVQAGGTVPAFISYADGAKEPAIWADQQPDLHRHFLKAARRLIRAAHLKVSR